MIVNGAAARHKNLQSLELCSCTSACAHLAKLDTVGSSIILGFVKIWPALPLNALKHAQWERCNLSLSDITLCLSV